MPLSTGCERLNALLGGGVPANRSLLVSGSPGTGKTTLGMQFLQAGLDGGEDCLFVSTEQTLEELEDALAPYPFDLNAENLTVITVHSEPGETMERDDDGVEWLTLEQSPTGSPGTSAVVDYAEDPPYVDLV
ncbi:RAD55 family ATPase [Halosimplex aquaticum]|uniref:RAD55 family ATPase n=1 Tax=Halosimplex aquaticum TaxID=3026162 RepID=A0ABD5Y9W8_9EURY|nr:ATPase domain-containing protein [Halosimplex aquaticum]